MANADIFLKLTNIKGESKDSKHSGEIDIDSFTFGLTNGGAWASGGGGGAGKVAFQDITFSKSADSSTGPLMEACAKGTHIKEGLLTVRKAGGQQEEFYKITLNDILVTSISNGGAAGGNPTETVSLNFGLIKFDYKEQAADGTLAGVVKFGWDIKKNISVG